MQIIKIMRLESCLCACQRFRRSDQLWFCQNLKCH